jgi:hypothetical protein
MESNILQLPLQYVIIILYQKIQKRKVDLMCVE